MVKPARIKSLECKFESDVSTKVIAMQKEENTVRMKHDKPHHKW